MDNSSLDLFNSLSQEDIDKLVERMLQQRQGKLLPPVAVRRTITISSLGTDEEIRQRLADAMEIPVDQLPPLNFTIKNESRWFR